MIFLVVLIGFGAGFIGGFFAVNMNSDFFSWIKSGLETNVIVRQPAAAPAASEESATLSAVKKISPATVSIVITKDISQFYNQTGTIPLEISEYQGPQKAEVGGGSGFIISADGFIVTNKHVIADASAEYSVILSDGRRFDAKIIASDPLMDLAFLKINAQDLPVVWLGDSDKLSIGQTVIAIGYSLSEYQNSVTKGIISGTKRRINAQGETIDQAIQTDAAINPGNSGGPLINLRGEVIGINTAINLEGQLIGFAIPINSAKKAIESIKTTGRIIRPWLGVRYLPLNAVISKANNLPVDFGALIVKGAAPTDFAVVPGSPADKAGLKENDIILLAGGVKLDDNNSLANVLGKYNVGDFVDLKVLRAGKEIIVKVKLEEFNNK